MEKRVRQQVTLYPRLRLDLYLEVFGIDSTG